MLSKMSNWFERMEREAAIRNRAEAAIQATRTAEISELVEALRIHELVENVRELWEAGDISLDVFDKPYVLRNEVSAAHKTYRVIRGSSAGWIAERHGESGHPLPRRWVSGTHDQSETHSYTSVFSIVLYMGNSLIHIPTSVRVTDKIMERIARGGGVGLKPGLHDWLPEYFDNTKNLQSPNSQDLELIVFNMMKTRKEREIMPADIEKKYPR